MNEEIYVRPSYRNLTRGLYGSIFSLLQKPVSVRVESKIVSGSQFQIESETAKTNDDISQLPQPRSLYCRIIGHVHKLNLGDLDQSRAISSGARPFVNYLRAIHSAFVNSGAKQSDRSDLIQAKSETKVPRPFVYISSGAKYDVDKSNAVIICVGKKW